VANAYHTADLLKLTLQKCGEKTDGSSRLHSLALSYINQVYHSILSGSNEFDVDIGEPWVWAREENPRGLILLPPYEDGSLNITEGSTTGTLTIAPSDSLVGWFLKVSQNPTFYQIRSHTAGSPTFTIDQEYVEQDAVNSEFKIVKTQYELGEGIERLVEPFRLYTRTNGAQDFGVGSVIIEDNEDKIFGMDVNAFRRKYPKRYLYRGVPTRFATIRRSQDSWTVEMNSYASRKIKIDYDVIPIQEDLVDSSESVPVIPREMRNILVYGASHFLCLDKEENEKAQYFFNLTKSKLKSMVEAEDKDETITGKNKGKILPRQGQLTPRRRFWRVR